jgi:hypothetical protein
MYTAVLVEPRKHKALDIVLSNFNRNLNEHWTFLIYHSVLNESFMIDLLQKHKMYSRCKRVILEKDNLSINEYNQLLYSEKFYEPIETDMFLIFQTDALISNTYKDYVYKFLHYDYVGAPWKANNKVGNGGLSLRKKSKMLEILKKHGAGVKHKNGKYCNEDTFFSNHTLDKPTVEEAKQFSVETLFSDKSFGLHKAWRHLNTKQVDELKVHFPELKELITLQR